MKMLVVMVAAAASAAFAAQAQTVTFAVGDGQFAVPVVVTIVIVSFLGRLFNPAIVITIVVGPPIPELVDVGNCRSRDVAVDRGRVR